MSGLDNGKVLLLDDDTFLQKIYTEKFAEARCSFHAATSVDDALRILRSGFVPDVLIVDIELKEKDLKLILASQDEYKLKAVTEILGQKLVKRQVPLKGLVYGTVTPAGGSTVKQEVSLQQGIPIEPLSDRHYGSGDRRLPGHQ